MSEKTASTRMPSWHGGRSADFLQQHVSIQCMRGGEHVTWSIRHGNSYLIGGRQLVRHAMETGQPSIAGKSCEPRNRVKTETQSGTSNASVPFASMKQHYHMIAEARVDASKAHYGYFSDRSQSMWYERRPKVQEVHRAVHIPRLEPLQLHIVLTRTTRF